jgi:hypothetical protein
METDPAQLGFDPLDDTKVCLGLCYCLKHAHLVCSLHEHATLSNKSVEAAPMVAAEGGFLVRVQLWPEDQFPLVEMGKMVLDEVMTSCLLAAGQHALLCMKTTAGQHAMSCKETRAGQHAMPCKEAKAGQHALLCMRNNIVRMECRP